MRAGSLPCSLLSPQSLEHQVCPETLFLRHCRYTDPLLALFSPGATVLSCLPGVASWVWELPGAPEPNTDPSGLGASWLRWTSLLHISDRLRRHALGKQIIEKITPGWDSWSVDLWHVILTSGVLLQIEEWLPNLGLVVAFNLHQSHRPALAPRVSAKSLCLRALDGTPSLLLLLSPSFCVHLLLLLLSCAGGAKCSWWGERGLQRGSGGSVSMKKLTPPWKLCWSSRTQLKSPSSMRPAHLEAVPFPRCFQSSWLALRLIGICLSHLVLEFPCSRSKSSLSMSAELWGGGSDAGEWEEDGRH